MKHTFLNNNKLILRDNFKNFAFHHNGFEKTFGRGWKSRAQKLKLKFPQKNIAKNIAASIKILIKSYFNTGDLGRKLGSKNLIIYLLIYFIFLISNHDMWKICLQTFRNNGICYKLAYFLRNLQTSRVNNSRILRIKNAKFWGYYFYMNTNI